MITLLQRFNGLSRFRRVGRAKSLNEGKPPERGACFWIGASIVLLAMLVSTLYLTAAPLPLQGSTATVAGTVVDENGAVIPGVTITIANIATRTTREVSTNTDGQFVIPLLPPATYLLTAQKQGFAPFSVPDLTLNVNDQRSLNIQLKVGDVTGQTVEIDSTEGVNTAPEVGTVVDQHLVQNLPLNGRSFQSLYAITPGVVLTKATGTNQGQFSVNGQRADANYLTVDGVSANIGIASGFITGQTGAGSIPGSTASGGTNNLVSIDALQEFKIQTSTYAPEFGRTPGAQISVITRSGTNDFHGSLFEYFRNDAMDANDFFANAGGQKKPALRQNIFGGVVGGPVLLPGYNGRNHTFFFVSYEGQRLRLPRFATTDVPSLAARRTAPAAMQPLLNAYPVPNGPDRPNGFASFASSFSNPSSTNATSVRIDHTFNAKVSLFGRYDYSPSDTSQRGGNGSSSLNTLNIVSYKTQTLTLGSTMTATANIVNDFRFNYSRNAAASSFLLDDFGGAVPPPDSYLFPAVGSSSDSNFSSIINGGNGTTSLLQGRLVDNLQRQINIVDSVSAVTGNHQMKFGVDYRRLFPVIGPRTYTLQPNFNGIGIGVQPAPVGSVFSQRLSMGSVGAENGARIPVFTNLSIYGQDTWRATPRLSVTYGVRWDYNPPPTEANGRDALTLNQINDPSTFDVAPRGTPLYRRSLNNFAPRVGLAYQLSTRPGHEMVLRGGFGVFYDLGSGKIADAFSGNTFPFATTKTLIRGTPFPLTPQQATPAPFPADPPLPPYAGSFTVADPHLKLPYTLQWNAAVEQSLGSDQTITASYVAAVGRRLLRSEALNRPNPRFPRFVNIFRNNATSDYHAMQLQFQRRLSRGLQALASYSLSKSIDIASSDSTASAFIARVNPRQDRGPSDFDVRHSFNAAVTYDLPSPSSVPLAKALFGGWEVDTLVFARSATPVNVVYFPADVGFGFTVLRPDLIQGVPLYISDSSVAGGRQINPNAFDVSSQLVNPRQGTLGRNTLRGFNLFQVDFGLSRRFHLSDRLNLQLKAEAFNLFNHPNFADPDGTLGDDNGDGSFSSNETFGQSTQMLGRSLGSGGINGGFNPLYQVGGPRSIQLSARFEF